jgi:dihydroorotate dehydrogenase
VKNSIIVARNRLIGWKYRWLLKPIFFKFDPENVHDKMSTFLQFCGKFYLTRKISYWFFGFSDKILEQKILGINFKNPIGLSAGFDKDANLIDIIQSIGFGFIEVGSITKNPYVGNPKPRLYRLPNEKTLRINYGLKNIGAEKIHEKLKNKSFPLKVGISIAKTNSSETSQVDIGLENYFFTYKLFQDVGDYFTINISCPNTCEEQPIFAEPKNLNLLLEKIFAIPKSKPVFLKLSPDLEDIKLNEILEVCSKYPLDGFVCTNLTKKNKFNHEGKGGFSGKAVSEESTKMIRKVYKYFNGSKIIIGVGGIFSAEDAYEKIKAGASLLELITGMIYEGPQLISDINLGLTKLLKKDGYKNISDAVGVENF